MSEYVLYMRTKSGDTFEIKRYNSLDEYEDDFDRVKGILKESEDWVHLHDNLIHKDEISIIRGEEIQLTLS